MSEHHHDHDHEHSELSELELRVRALETVLAPKAIVLRADAPSRALEGLESYVRAEKGDAKQDEDVATQFHDG